MVYNIGRSKLASRLNEKLLVNNYSRTEGKNTSPHEREKDYEKEN